MITDTGLINSPRIKDYCKAIITYLGIFCIFSEAIVFRFEFMPHMFKFYNLALPISIICVIFLWKRIYFNKIFLTIFLLLIYFSIYNLLMDNTTFRSLFEQILAISVHSLAYYLLIKINDTNVEKLFAIYINCAFIVSLIGIIQVTAMSLYNKGIISNRLFFDFRYFLPNWRITMSSFGKLRLNSILPDSSSLYVVLTPALFASAAFFANKQFRLVSVVKHSVIIMAYLLTYSLMAYAGFTLTVIMLSLGYIKKRYVAFIFVAIALVAITLYFVIPDFKVRVEETYAVLTERKPLTAVNLSTYTLLQNARITREAIKENPIIGRGLGSHETSYNRYIQDTLVSIPSKLVALNKKDANSLFLRLLSETGIFGLFIFLFFIFKCYVAKSKAPDRHLWIINNAIFILLLLRLIRQGNYISEGFFFFFWLYYFTKKLTDQVATP